MCPLSQVINRSVPPCWMQESASEDTVKDYLIQAANLHSWLKFANAKTDIE